MQQPYGNKAIYGLKQPLCILWKAHQNSCFGFNQVKCDSSLRHSTTVVFVSMFWSMRMAFLLLAPLVHWFSPLY